MLACPSSPIKLYRHPLSGHAHRVELAMSLLGLSYELIDVDLLKGEHKQPPFLARNPFGQVPVIDDGGTVVYDSNAILVYLAIKYDTAGAWLPRDPVGASSVQRWLSWAAGQLATGPASARLVTVFGAKLDHDRAKGIADGFFKVLDGELAGTSFAIGERPTLADIAGYSYVSKAPEGGIPLAPYANIRAWLKRVEALPGFVPFVETKAGLLAEAA